MPNADTPQPEQSSDKSRSKEQPRPKSKTRLRASLSCTECRRRKQKCNQAKDRPCNHCARRYPPVECVYEPFGNNGDKDKIVNGEQSTSNIKRDSSWFPAAPVVSVSRSLPIQHSIYSPTLIKLANSKLSSAIDTRKDTTSQEEQTHSGNSYDISSIFLIDQPRTDAHFYEYFDNRKYGFDLVPVSFGGSAADATRWLPLDGTERNAELLHFFIQRLSPYTSSLDGHDPPPAFTTQWMKFLVQSPLVVYLSILSAAYFQATARRINVEKSVDAVATRTRLIGLINEHISGCGSTGGISDEAIAAVMSLSYNELIYSDEKSVLAHMSGLRSMIRTRGGVDNIENPILRVLLARTDYQIACTYEIESFLHKPRSDPHPKIMSPTFGYDSPFLNSEQRLSDSLRHFNISTEAAKLLDNLRSLITSIVYFPHPEDPVQKIVKTATSLQQDLTDSPTPPHLQGDHLYLTIHTTALIVLYAITSRSSLSDSCTASLLQKLWSTLWRVPLPRWKKMPGIFLWVLLVVSPYTKDKPEGRFVKGMIAAGYVGVAVVDPDIAEGILRGCMGLQSWLETESKV